MSSSQFCISKGLMIFRSDNIYYNKTIIKLKKLFLFVNRPNKTNERNLTKITNP